VEPHGQLSGAPCARRKKCRPQNCCLTNREEELPV